MKFTTIVICTLCLLFTACAAYRPPAAARGQAIRTLNPRPSVPDVTETASSRESDLVPPALPALRLVTTSQEGDWLSARPADPLGLADLPGYQPVNFGHLYTQALSPDGRTLALITWPGGMSNQDGLLHLVELPAWIDHLTNVTFDDFVGSLVFSPDGKQLLWSEPTRTDSAHGLPRDYRLYRYDLDSGVRSEVLQLPASFDPWEMHLLTGGSRLAIYGLPTTPDNLAEDVPHILLVDLDAGRLAADLRLERVTAGQMEVATAGVNESPYRIYRPGLGPGAQPALPHSRRQRQDYRRRPGGGRGAPAG